MTSFPLPILAFVENNDGMADRPLLNEQIKALQENAELTNEVAARIMGIPLRTYMRWRSGQSEPGVDGLIALGDLYGVSLNALIGVEAPRKRSGATGGEHRKLEPPDERTDLASVQLRGGRGRTRRGRQSAG